jgi:uncharacterized protein YgiM (DUF1202 family)
MDDRIPSKSKSVEMTKEEREAAELKAKVETAAAPLNALLKKWHKGEQFQVNNPLDSKNMKGNLAKQNDGPSRG